MDEESPFLPDILSGKVAFITGGGSGIGFEIARQFGLHGATVYIMGRRKEVLEKSVSILKSQNIHAYYFKGDVRHPEDCENALKYATMSNDNKLDILVNSAAGNFLAKAEDLSLKGFKTVMEIDAYGVFNTSKAAYPYLCRASGGGCIINISMTLHYGATWYQTHACAAKAAIDSITRNLALEWGRNHIRVNAIAPGAIEDTAGFSKLAPISSEMASKQLVETTPLKRFGKSYEIAHACIYLASDSAKFVTGSILVVDGGAWLYKEPIVPLDKVRKLSKAVEKSAKNVGVPFSNQSKL